MSIRLGTLSAEDFQDHDWEDEEGILEWSRSTENHPVDLPPEEHFASLKSYVQGIAELGLGTMMASSYYSEQVNPQTLPFGFNSYMHSQVMKCLAAVAPSAMNAILRDLLLELATSVPPEWFLSRLEFLEETYDRENVEKVLFGDVDTFKAFDEQLKSPELRERALHSRSTSPELFFYLFPQEPTDTSSVLEAIFPEIDSNSIRSNLENTMAFGDVQNLPSFLRHTGFNRLIKEWGAVQLRQFIPQCVQTASIITIGQTSYKRTLFDWVYKILGDVVQLTQITDPLSTSDHFPILIAQRPPNFLVITPEMG